MCVSSEALSAARGVSFVSKKEENKIGNPALTSYFLPALRRLPVRASLNFQLVCLAYALRIYLVLM